MLDGIEMVEPVMQYNHLYFAVARASDQHEQLRDDLDDALAEFAESGELYRIIEDTGEACGYDVDATLAEYGIE